MENIEYYKNLSLELLTGYDDEGNFHVEEFKDIPNFEDYYQLSTFGRVKSIERISSQKHLIPTKILKCAFDKDGYLVVGLSKNDKKKTFRINRIVGLTFIPNPENKPQVNHINTIKTNNCVWNLEWNTSRENNTHRSSQKKSSSQYTGVYWKKAKKAWEVYIYYKGKNIFLGYFKIEIEAHNIYQKAVADINDDRFILPIKRQISSKYKGVSWSSQINKWYVYITHNKKQIYLGAFSDELDGCKAYMAAEKELSETGNVTRFKKITSSKYKGVSFNKRNNKWYSYINISGNKTIHIGHFKTELEAYEAREVKLKEIQKFDT